MESLVRYALPALVVVASLGAFAMCILVFRYGLPGRDDDPERHARALNALRFGHAFAAVGFAVVAVLAVAVWWPVARPVFTLTTPGGPAPGPGPTPVGSADPTPVGSADPTPVGSMDPQPRPAPAQAVETPPAASNGAPAAAAPVNPIGVAEPRGAGSDAPAARQVEAPPAAAGREDPPSISLPPANYSRPLTLPDRDRTGDGGGEPRAPLPPPQPSDPRPGARSSNGAGEHPSALPTESSAGRRLRATIRGVKIDVENRADGNELIYVVRLADAAGRPVHAASVTLQGRTPDGVPLSARAEPDGEPGVYRGRIGRVPEPRDLRLRVVQSHGRLEMALGDPLSWE